MDRTEEKRLTRFPIHDFRFTAFGLLLGFTATLHAQTRGAELAREQKPVYPAALSNAIAQGNVILIGRIDKNGTVQDAKAVFTTHEQFVEPTLTAVKAWVFRPALKNGQPIDIAANIVFPFRIKDDQGKNAGREIPSPALSELAIFPADFYGMKSAPEGFPIRLGADPRLRVEIKIDLPPVENARDVTIIVEAVSPTGRHVPVYEDKSKVPAKGPHTMHIFSVAVGKDWEEGIWMLRFQADKRNAGTGQFWLARDPDRFDFAAALKKK
ncbi:MAG: energy transducer TonB [Thermoanaerobaculia bacterium]